MDNNTTTFAYYDGSSWAKAWQNRLFRTKLIAGLLTFTVLLLLLPHFFAFIEKREGTVINDWFLQMITPMNFSIVIFILIWSVFILALIRCIQEPGICLIILLSVVALLILRMISIYFIALDPPEGLIVLTDPLTSLTYGGRSVFITKDLFFSGHTSNLFMVYLCLQKKGDKIFVLLSSLAVAILVLVQHVHYSIDVLGAFLITFLLVKGIKKILYR